MDVFTKEKRSQIMSRIRSSVTKPELAVFSYLRREKVYFQKHYRKAPGRPDVALPRKKVAVFIDGDFWHGWKFEQWKTRIPQEYWRAKIEGNIRRDRRNFSKLRRSGWRVMRVWEHQLKPRTKEKTLRRIRDFLSSSG